MASALGSRRSAPALAKRLREYWRFEMRSRVLSHRPTRTQALTLTPHRVTLVNTIAPDYDSRPGSTISLLRTVIGLYLRQLDSRISVSALVALMHDLGVSDSLTRTAILRLKKRGLLLAERTPTIGYRLNPDAHGMLESGDRRIFAVRTMHEDDDWCLISFSIPESNRALRHTLRKRLHWIGFGTVSSALWICPGHLRGEVHDILDELGASQYAVTFLATDPAAGGSLREAVAQWWDFDELAAHHVAFREAVSDHVMRAETTSGDAGTPAASDARYREAFARYVRLIDHWRPIPYVDPGLPAAWLPKDWPGTANFALFQELARQLAPNSLRHVRATVDSHAR